jgi:hypothetical protein
MRHRHRDFGPNNEASLHWRHNLSSPYPADPDDRLLSGLSQKSLVPASEIFRLNLPRTGQGFPIRKREWSSRCAPAALNFFITTIGQRGMNNSNRITRSNETFLLSPFGYIQSSSENVAAENNYHTRVSQLRAISSTTMATPKLGRRCLDNALPRLGSFLLRFLHSGLVLL